MYISGRGAIVRNFAVAAVNGSITLIVLLIAPLGLAAVIINTALVTMASLVTASIADRVVAFLLPVQQAELVSKSTSTQIRRVDE